MDRPPLQCAFRGSLGDDLCPPPPLRPFRVHARCHSMSGLAQFVASRGLGTLREWCEEGYKAVSKIDQELSGEGIAWHAMVWHGLQGGSGHMDK